MPIFYTNIIEALVFFGKRYYLNLREYQTKIGVEFHYLQKYLPINFDPKTCVQMFEIGLVV